MLKSTLMRYVVLCFVTTFAVLAQINTNQVYAAKPHKAVVINMGQDNFSPASIKIFVGQRVTWLNAGDHIHDVTSMENDFHANVPPHQSYSHTFTKPGTYYYVCSKHSILFWGMKGKIVVIDPHPAEHA